jgi:type II secretory pathway component PulC
VFRSSPATLLLVLACACNGAGDRIDVEKAERAVDEAQKQVEVASQQVEGGLRTARDRVEDVGEDLGKAAGQVGTQVRSATAEAVPVASEAELSALVAEAKTAIACEQESCTIQRAFADRLRAKPVAMASQAKVDPEQRDGQTVGLRMSEVGEIPRLLGFQERDVMLTINGMPLRSLQGIPQLALQLRSATRFAVEYERAGTSSTKMITIE